jgi:hypothetical protein
MNAFEFLSKKFKQLFINYFYLRFKNNEKKDFYIIQTKLKKKYKMQQNPGKLRYGLVIYLTAFQIASIILFYVFGEYSVDGNGKHDGEYSKTDKTPKFYASMLKYSIRKNILAIINFYLK